MRDLKHSIAVRPSLPPAARTATISGGAVDRLGFESVTFLVHVGAWTNGAHALSAEHSDDGEDWDAVAAADLLGSFPVITDAADDGETFTVGYLGLKRHVRLKATVTGSPETGAVYGAIVILGHAHQRPAA